jgi:hypothetical protein
MMNQSWLTTYAAERIVKHGRFKEEEEEKRERRERRERERERRRRRRSG